MGGGKPGWCVLKERSQEKGGMFGSLSLIPSFSFKVLIRQVCTQVAGSGKYVCGRRKFLNAS